MTWHLSKRWARGARPPSTASSSRILMAASSTMREASGGCCVTRLPLGIDGQALTEDLMDLANEFLAVFAAGGRVVQLERAAVAEPTQVLAHLRVVRRLDLLGLNHAVGRGFRIALDLGRLCSALLGDEIERLIVAAGPGDLCHQWPQVARRQVSIR